MRRNKPIGGQMELPLAAPAAEAEQLIVDEPSLPQPALQSASDAEPPPPASFEDYGMPDVDRLDGDRWEDEADDDEPSGDEALLAASEAEAAAREMDDVEFVAPKSEQAVLRATILPKLAASSRDLPKGGNGRRRRVLYPIDPGDVPGRDLNLKPDPNWVEELDEWGRPATGPPGGPTRRRPGGWTAR